MCVGDKQEDSVGGKTNLKNTEPRSVYINKDIKKQQCGYFKKKKKKKEEALLLLLLSHSLITGWLVTLCKALNIDYY